jgi:hypothetical protein
MLPKRDFRDRIISHKLSVKAGIQRVILDLQNRGEHHDDDKLYENSLTELHLAMEKYSSTKFCSSKYLEIEEEPVIKLHYINNDHHPNHFKDGIMGMNLISMIEMLIDWKSASSAYGDTFEESLEKNKERFKIGDDLFRVLKNTAIYLGYMEE